MGRGILRIVVRVCRRAFPDGFDIDDCRRAILHQTRVFVVGGHDCGPAVFHHEANAVFGIGRIKTHVPGACFKDAHESAHPFNRPIHKDADNGIRAHSQRSKDTSKLIRGAVQPGVTQLILAIRH